MSDRGATRYERPVARAVRRVRTAHRDSLRVLRDEREFPRDARIARDGLSNARRVGSGLAFVFGTSVIATLKHRDLGQVDYKLGVSMIIGTTAGIEVGKELVLWLEELGFADGVVGAESFMSSVCLG